MRVFRVAVAACSVGLGALLIGLELAAVEGELTRDVATEADVVPWTGAISTFGLLVWSAMAGACVVTALALSRHGLDESARFLGATGLLIGYLALDDAFLLHEQIAPYYVGVPQPVVYLLLVALVAMWAIRFRAAILRSDRLLFGVAGAVLGVAVLADVSGALPIPAEDWLKCVGLGALAAWAGELCVRSIDQLAGRADKSRVASGVG